MIRRVCAPATLYSQKMISLGSRLIACCKLAPTLARQMWRHNYVIDRNEYLIFTFSESTIPCVYSLQFLFKSTNNSWRYERKCEWVFFSEHSVYTTNYDQSVSTYFSTESVWVLTLLQSRCEYLLFYRVGLLELSRPVQITAQCCSTVSYDSLDNV